MGTPLGGICQILCATGKSPDSDKKLLISAHGKKCEKEFNKPFATAVSFCGPSSYGLSARLEDAIVGKIDPFDTNIKKSISDYDLTHYEKDPSPDLIKGLLSDKAFNVLVILQGCNATLSRVLELLKGRYQYTSIWCLFCRVTELSNVWQGGVYAGPNFQGTTNPRTLDDAMRAGDTFRVNQEYSRVLGLRQHQPGSPALLSKSPGPTPSRVGRPKLPPVAKQV